MDAHASGPTVSIVTPCLNPGARLARCLASVAAQAYPRVEHLVVDGGSTDGTLDLLGAAAGVRWVSEPDGGQVEAINKGLALASGSILTWLNADDTLEPAAVARAVEAFARRPALGLVFGSCRIVEDGRELLTWRPPRRLTFRTLAAGSSIPQPGSFFRRSALDRVGPLDASFELAMDVDLWLRLLAAGIENRRLPGVVSTFELHPGSKTGSVPRQRFHEENVRAFRLAGRPDCAAVSLGQAAAAAATEGARVPEERLQAEIRAALEAGAGSSPPLPARTIRAAAAAEAAVIELRGSLGGLRHLLVVDVWLDRRARRRVAAAIRRGWPRIALRLLARGGGPR
jgi:Glycosyl transferase family 2